MNIQDALQYLDTTSRVSCPTITCEQAAELAALLRGYDREWERIHTEADSCADESWDFQQEACGFAWDAGREIADKEKARAEAESLFFDERTKVYKAEVALLAERSAHRQTLGELERRNLALADRVTTTDDSELTGRFVGNDQLTRGQIRRIREDLGLKDEATGNLDPGIYEGTGKGFEK